MAQPGPPLRCAPSPALSPDWVPGTLAAEQRRKRLLDSVDALFEIADTAITHGHLLSWQQRRRQLVSYINKGPQP